jgi:predicted nucleic acid-binding Zn ribbon protein
MERWKDIPGFDKYEISTLGRVRHKFHKHILKYSYPYNGYPQVKLSLNGEHGDKVGGITKCVHSLVFITFVRSLLKGEEINHKDNNRANPALNNLEVFANKKEHGKVHRTLQYRNCLECGKEIKPSSLYCSRECRLKNINVERQCKYCGGSFYISKKFIAWKMNDIRYANGAGIYCSRKCFYSDRKGNPIRRPFYPFAIKESRGK